MARILTSVRGRSLGLDDRRRLIAPAGFVAGDHGSQIALPSPSTVSFFDDFLGDLVADEWNFVEGTDAATSSAVIVAGGIGGVLRMTTGDTGSIAGDMEQANLGLLQWQASNGGLVFETRIKLSQIIDCYAFLGFTDVATFEAPIISASSGNNITTNASDAVGFGVSSVCAEVLPMSPCSLPA